MRHLLLLALMLSGCAGFRALDRGEWVLVWTDESVQTEMVNGTPIEVTKPAPGAKQTIIPLERYESEVAEGKRRSATAPLGQVPKHLNSVASPVELMVGEVRELIVDEPQEVQLQLQGDCVRPFWTKRKEVADWKGDQPADRKESSLFLIADDPGTAKVKIISGSKEPQVVEIQVHAK